MAGNRSNDKIIHVTVEDEVQTFIDAVEMYGSEELICGEAIYFFVARAVSYSNPDIDAEALVNRVMNKIQDSIKRYYYKSTDTSDIEARIIDAWTNMARSIRGMLERHIYESDNVKDKVVTLKSYSTDGVITAIVCDRERDWETCNGWGR